MCLDELNEFRNGELTAEEVLGGYMLSYEETARRLGQVGPRSPKPDSAMRIRTPRARRPAVSC